MRFSGSNEDLKMWVLETQQHGKPVYFKEWSNYEPVTTEKVEEAKRFDSKRDAKFSQAYRDKQSSFVPVEVGLAVKVKAA